jgi:uroporphyrinogen-III synthase
MVRDTAHILTTRPWGQHQRFHERLQQLGFTISHLPCLVIEPLVCRLLQTDPGRRFDTVLFTSANAVRLAHAQRAFPWPEINIHAIGSATARELEEHGQTLALQPVAPFNSESYLLQMNQVQPERLLIVKGEGGRTMISEKLQERGWEVSHADVYRRRLPVVEHAKIARLFSKPVPDIVSVTSNEALENLVTLAGEYRPALLRLPLVLNSERAAALARQLGFASDTLVANPPGDDGQLQTLRHWMTCST